MHLNFCNSSAQHDSQDPLHEIECTLATATVRYLLQLLIIIQSLHPGTEKHLSITQVSLKVLEHNRYK